MQQRHQTCIFEVSKSIDKLFPQTKSYQRKKKSLVPKGYSLGKKRNLEKKKNINVYLENQLIFFFLKPNSMTQFEKKNLF